MGDWKAAYREVFHPADKQAMVSDDDLEVLGTEGKDHPAGIFKLGYERGYAAGREASMKGKTMEERWVLVTTDKDRRGVFAGRLIEHDAAAATATLADAHMAVYWSSDVRGVLGLVATGPTDNCRITPAVPRIELNGVTSVADLTEAAVKAWRRQPWK